jgi:unsaturated chondroitin disaccharide hydrolase
MSSDGDWTGGFFVGQLWLAARDGADAEAKALATGWALRLTPRVESQTVFRGFLFWYGVVIGLAADEDERLVDAALAGARSLAADRNPHAGLIPLGPAAEEASDVGAGETNIDGVPGTVLLLDWAAAVSGDESLRSIALEHASGHRRMCIRDDGGVIQSASFDPSTGALIRRYTHKGYSDQSVWGRAQAWGLLGMTHAAVLDPGEFLDTARAVADWWIARLPADHVARWDFDDPDPAAPIDTSATAIAAAALLKLAALDPRAPGAYRATAESSVDALVRGHVAPASTGRGAGMLLHGCYNRRIGLATDDELVWGTYFLTEALASLNGRLDISRI